MFLVKSVQNTLWLPTQIVLISWPLPYQLSWCPISFSLWNLSFSLPQAYEIDPLPDFFQPLLFLYVRPNPPHFSALSQLVLLSWSPLCLLPFLPDTFSNPNSPASSHYLQDPATNQPFPLHFGQSYLLCSGQPWLMPIILAWLLITSYSLSKVSLFGWWTSSPTLGMGVNTSLNPLDLSWK